MKNQKLRKNSGVLAEQIEWLYIFGRLYMGKTENSSGIPVLVIVQV